MTKVTFPTALRHGLGRAFNYVRDYGDTGVEQHILNTIIHDLGYDPQCEGSRGAWLFEMLTYVKDIEPYRRKVIELLGKEASTWDARQHLDIALEFARRGDAEMRRAIYAMFERQEHNESYIGGDQIIALDG